MANQPSPNKTFVGVRLPNPVVDAADACAAVDEITRANVLIAALREYLTRRGFMPATPQ